MKSSRIILISLIFIIASICLSAQEWAVGGLSGAGDNNNSIVTDSAGNSYITGSFNLHATLGGFQLFSFGTTDVFVAKLDSAGNWLWAVRGGGSGDEIGNDITLDTQDNIYVTGSFTGSSSFGSTSFVSAGSKDIFVAKLDNNGNWLWATRAGGTGSDEGTAILIQQYNDNIYVTGYYHQSATFGSNTQTRPSNTDFLFFAELNSTGTWNDVYSVSGNGSSRAYDICLDNSFYYLTGAFSGTIDYSSTYTTGTLTSAGGEDIFILKIKLLFGGVFMTYATSFGSSGNDRGTAITSNGSDIYLTGYFSGAVNFPSNQLISGNSYSDVFVARINSNDYWVWAVKAGGYGIDEAGDIAIDNQNYVYLTGTTMGNAYFGTTTITGLGSRDTFFAKLDENGNWLWAKCAIGFQADVYGCGISVNNDSYCYVIGHYDIAGFGYGAVIFGSTYLYNDNDIGIFRVAEPVGQSPQNITISNLGYDIIIDWDPVTLDTWNNRFVPTYYFVYYNSTGMNSPYQYLTFIPHTISQYVHQHAGFFSSNHFYRVTAVKFYSNNRSTESMNTWLRENLHPGMVESDVKEALMRIQ
jgi:hypothetical protein